MNKEDIFKIIVGHLVDVLPEIDQQSIAMNNSLKDLGASSIDRADIMIMTMESLGLKFPLNQLSEARNIGELVDILSAKL